MYVAPADAPAVATVASAAWATARANSTACTVCASTAELRDWAVAGSRAEQRGLRRTLGWVWQVKKDHFVQAYMGYTPYKFQLDAWVRWAARVRCLPPCRCHLPALQGGPECCPCPETPGALHCAAATVLCACVDGSAAANARYWREQGKQYLGGDEVMTANGHDFDFPCNVSEDGVVHCPA
jgi:hypothetical protein